ncbi:MAG: cyclodeaminase/cyclohydrolase family protein [Candidatus Omnitrophica bacterium]|nr:cyclodeaminase/cyclohydrolase family protein [Candidatus Omnitrophota bacterium]MDD5430384.1 cyclodeaminase/cyclohydrolase family protein [Candidatus Omnitrophota bacterium]
MKGYKRYFKTYLSGLASLKPSPGGGSVAALAFCLGTALIEKALVFSCPKNPATPALKKKNKKITARIKKIRSLSGKPYHYIDEDGDIFEQIMSFQGAKKKRYVDKSQNLIADLGSRCRKIFFITQEVEIGVKKCIISDFILGLDLVKLALKGCVLNLEANKKMFGVQSRQLGVFKNTLKKWQ